MRLIYLETTVLFPNLFAEYFTSVSFCLSPSSLLVYLYLHGLFLSLFPITKPIFIMFFFSFSFCPVLIFLVIFSSIPLIPLGPLTAQPNYNKFLIFHSLFAHTLSSPLTSLHVPSISLSASFSTLQNYRPSWIRSCFCHCDGNAWYRLIMKAVLVSTLGPRVPEFKGL